MELVSLLVTLAALRDWRLPLLLNGQVAVGCKTGKTSQVSENL